MAKEFSLRDVLTITTGRLLGKMDGVYSLLSYLTGDDIYTHSIPRVMGVCRPELLKQHPQLDSAEMQVAVGELFEMLKSPSGRAEPKALIDGWLCKMTLLYGEALSVEPMRPADYEHIDPIEEAERMAGRVFIVQS